MPIKAYKIKFVLLLMFAVSSTYAGNLLKECKADLSYKYMESEVRHKREFIQIYDQYSKFLISHPKQRLDKQGNPINGEHKDYYDIGKLLHKGNYENGYLLDFTNYYPDGTKERILKLKKGKPDFFESYFDTKQIMQGARFEGNNLVSRTKFTINEYKRYIEKREPNGILTLQEKYNDFKRKLEMIELIDGGKRIYKITKWYLTGELKEVGEYKYDNEENKYVLHGLRVKYTKRGEEMSRKEYKEGELTNTLEETDTYQGKLPKEYRYFDRDKNDDISKKEIDWGINAFFSDDPKVEYKTLMGLINYFFDQ